MAGCCNKTRVPNRDGDGMTVVKSCPNEASVILSFDSPELLDAEFVLCVDCALKIAGVSQVPVEVLAIRDNLVPTYVDEMFPC